MYLQKKMFFFSLIFILISLSACSQVEEEENGNMLKNDLELETDAEVENDLETEIDDQTNMEKEQVVTTFQHVHGLAYELSAPYDLFLGTHHGVFQIDPNNYWKLLGTKQHQHDVMGFNFIDENTMISSGHPSETSGLKNPIGVIISKDKAESWEPIALHGEVDFHTFEVNASDSGVLYGIDHSGFYRSEDGGHSWDNLQPNGLPETLQDIYSVVSDPENPDSLLAGTKYGVYKSENGGESWELMSNQETFISAKAAYGQAGSILAYVQGNKDNGLMKSEDFGLTWNSLNLTLEDEEDAVAHIAIHPLNNKEYSVGTFKGYLYRTKDGGESWTTIAKENESVIN